MTNPPPDPETKPKFIGPTGLTKEQLERIAKEGKEIAKNLFKPKEIIIKEHGKCRLCDSSVVNDTTREYNPRSGPPIMGSGSRNQYHEVTHGYYCSNCGLKYQFPPPLLGEIDE